METIVIEAIKNEPDKDKQIHTMHNLLDILMQESKILCNAIQEKDKDFVIEILEMQVKIFHEDLREIVKYAQKKYGVVPEDNQALDMVEFLMKGIKVQE
jgi:hypothetical protein